MYPMSPAIRTCKTCKIYRPFNLVLVVVTQGITDLYSRKPQTQVKALPYRQGLENSNWSWKRIGV